jgi:hypothetical protein
MGAPETKPSFMDQLIPILDVARTYSEAREWTDAARLLAHGRIRVTDYDYSEEWGPDFRWRIVVEILPGEFAKLGDRHDRIEVESNITDAIREVVQDRFTPHHVGIVSVVPRLDLVSTTAPKPTGINNQGRAHSQNPAGIEYEGLRFRTRSEIVLFRALKAADLLVAPLPVFVKLKATRPRVEPDFLVVKDNVTLIIEVDGGSHQERPVEAQERLAAFKAQGIEVLHVDANDLGTDEQAQKVLKRILDRLRELKVNRI